MVVCSAKENSLVEVPMIFFFKSHFAFFAENLYVRILKVATTRINYRSRESKELFFHYQDVGTRNHILPLFLNISLFRDFDVNYTRSKISESML